MLLTVKQYNSLLNIMMGSTEVKPSWDYKNSALCTHGIVIHGMEDIYSNVISDKRLV